MAKYPISKEFFPFNLFAPPMSRRFVLLAQKGIYYGMVQDQYRDFEKYAAGKAGEA